MAYHTTVTLKQAVELIVACPDVRFLLRGEKGIGKSSIMTMLSKRLPEHHMSYVDCGNLDLGDVALPNMNHETQTMTHFVNELFGLHMNKPVVIMLDEFTKAAQPVKNMLHPLLEQHNPRLGTKHPKQGSIVIATGNLADEGVGDMLPAHSRNRIVELIIRKPDADEWLEWATNNDVHPAVCAFVKRNPQVLASFLDGNIDGNPFVTNPKQQQGAVVTPRSLKTVSTIMQGRDVAKFDNTSLMAAVAGAAGEPFAREFEAFVAYQDELPSKEDVMKDPENAVLPTSDGARCVLVFNAIEMATDVKSADILMRYVERLGVEWQSVFAINIAKNERKQAFIFKSANFAKWVEKNQDLL